MIRKILYSLTALFAFTIITSCEDTNGDNFYADKEAGWVQFENDEIFEVPFGDVTYFEVPVVLNTNVNVSGLNAYYSIVDLVGSSASLITDHRGFVRFEKGQTKANIVMGIKTSNIEAEAEGVQFDIKITSVNRPNVDIGASESHPIVKRVCVRKFKTVTVYNGESYSVVEDEDGKITETYVADFTTTLTSTDVEDVYEISSAWGNTFVPSQTGNPAHASILYPGTITFRGNGTLVLDGNGVFNGNVYTTEGNMGTISPCSGSIFYELEQSLFSDDSRVRIVLTPAN